MGETPVPSPDAIRELVRSAYGAAEGDPAADEIALRVGYTREQLDSLPQGANLGFGCGNPIARADLAAGEVVLDLGCGAGCDLLLAAEAVGPSGRAIGIDMTSHMLEQARTTAERAGYGNVEFYESLFERLPQEDESVDVVISNGSINYSPERARTLGEAHRVLRPGGRLVVADTALARKPSRSLAHIARYFLGDPPPRDVYVRAVTKAGFLDVEMFDRLKYGRLVFGGSQAFRAVAKEEGASPAAIERLIDDLSSFVIRARKW